MKPKLHLYGIKDIDKIPQLKKISKEERQVMKAVAHVLPFRVNNYVIENLIDWNRVPDDPIFRLTFPQKEMLNQENLDKVSWLLNNNVTAEHKQKVINSIRMQLNPHPAGQAEHNIPTLNNQPVPGIQHKYPETVLVFPTAAQTCHTYCTFCFRWPQFVGMDNVAKFATGESGVFQEYLHLHQEVTDVLITGGDPMVMKARYLALYIEPLLDPKFDHIQTIRIGTKSISYWPYRYITDEDADDILRLFEKVVGAGKRLALMGHFEHWQELRTLAAQKAIGRILSTGAQIRTQAPVLNRINNSSQVWIRMWKEQVKLGLSPYYMFVPRNTGAKHYFDIPLVEAWQIFQGAIQKVSGLDRTVRGPVMSTFLGKVVINGVSKINHHQIFNLSFIQAREPNWCYRPFYARYDPEAKWFTDLVSAFDGEQSFGEQQLQNMLGQNY